MKELIPKYTSNTINKEELVVLQKWLKEPKNQSVFKKFVIDAYHLEYLLSNPNVEEAYLKVANHKDAKTITVKSRINNYLKYAATVVLLISLGYFFTTTNKTHSPSVENEELTIPNESITLQLENGEIKPLGTKNAVSVKSETGMVLAKENESEIIYKNVNNYQKLVYNTLNIPYGKKYQITLSDGTKVFLNAGSQLKYPINFIEGKPREVYLKGEAFFDVTANPSNPFKVNAQSLNITVLGTKFNVSDYEEDIETSVVLAEGKIELTTNSNSKVQLNPNQIVTFNKNKKDLSILKNIDTSPYLAWMDGRIVFDNIPFEKITKKLERHYNVVIKSYNKNLNKELYTAKFDNETIEDVLLAFSKNYEINYTIKNNEVIINQ